MRYIPIARRYRPKTFDDVVGQDVIIKTLKAQIESGKIHHAYLFSGTRGVGKTTTARLIAKALNCEKGITSSPCNACTQCLAIDEGNSLSLIEIDGASNRGIDEVRNLQEKIRQKPLQGRFKVVIIDEVHMLTTEAFNALLKTIEEPPEHTVFVLATTEYHKVPLTIISRTQHFHFREIPEEIISAQLQKIAQKEGIELEEEAAEVIARAAEGSMRDAETLLEKVVAFSEGKITREIAEKVVGVVAEAIMDELTRAIALKERAKIFEIVSTIVIGGYDLRKFLRDYVVYLRNQLLRKIKGKPSAATESLSQEDLLRFMQVLLDGEYKIRGATNPRVFLEFLLLKLSYLTNIVDLEKIIESFARSSVTVSPSKEDKKAVEPPAQFLPKFLDEVDKRSKLLAGALNRAVKLKLEKNELLIFFRSEEEFLLEKVREAKEELEEIAEGILGRKIALKAESLSTEKKTEKEEEVLKNPKIDLLQKVLKAQFVKKEKM